MRFLKKYIHILWFLVGTGALGQNIGINSNGATPNASAMLDIDVSALASKKGLLIPRMTLTQLSAMNPLPAPAQGLIVYQTDGMQGFYYNTSTTTTPSWQYLLPASGSSGGWGLSGNFGTDPTSNFLGTIDANDLVIKTQNLERLRVKSTGQLGINENNPVLSLQVRTYPNGVISTPFDGIKLTSPTQSNIYQSGSMFGIDDGSINGSMGTNAQLWNFEQGFIRFGTNNSERMRITSDGKISVNETNPVSAFTIRPFYNWSGANIDGIHIVHPSLPATSLNGLILGVDNISGGNDAYLMNNQSGNLSFGTGTQERMRITSTGNVAIGTNQSASTSLANLVIKDNQGVRPGIMVLNPGFAPGTPGVHFGLDPGNPLIGRIWNHMNSDFEFGTNDMEVMRFTNNGNVGIGTSSPGYRLEVNGTGHFSSYLSIGNYMLPSLDGTNGQVLQTNGSGIVSWTTPASGGVTDVGLTMPTIFSVNNSPIYNSGNIDVSLQSQAPNEVFAGPVNGASNTPSFRSLVAADIPSGVVTADNGLTVNTGNNVRLGGTLSTPTSLTQGSNSLTITNNGTANTIVNLSSTGDFDVQDNGTSAFFVGDNANVGIGTNTPAEKLDVNGKTKTTQLQMTTGAGSGYILTSDASGNATWQNPASSLGAWNITGNSGTAAGTNFIGTTDIQDVVIKTNSNEVMRVKITGYVGIGTNTPAAKLHVSSGYIMIDDYYHIKCQNGNKLIGSFGGDLEIGQYGISGKTWIYTPANGTYFGASSSADHGIFTTLGYLGLGTTSPTQRLDVNGNVQFFGALMPGGQAGTSGQVLTSGGPGALPIWTPIGGTLSGGTTNYVTKWTSATSLSSTSLLYDSGTNVGVGTSSPLVKLDVRGSNAKATTALFANYFSVASTDAASPLSLQIGIKTDATATNRYAAIEVDDAGTKRNLILQPSSGNVGIGTTAPAYKLEVSGTGKFSSSVTVGAYTLPNTDGTNGQVLKTNGSGVLTWSADNGGPFSGWGLTGNAGTAAGTNFIGTTDAVDLVMKTNGSEWLRLNSSGNLGIGNANPQWQTDIVIPGSTSGTGLNIRTSVAGAATAYLRFTNTSNNDNSGNYSSFIGGERSAGGHSLVFGTATLGGAPSEKMRINETGNVGIGCNAPQYKLHVIGDIAASGTLRASSATVSTTISACSDIRFKKDFTALDNSLEKVLRIEGFNYYWKKDQFPDRYFNDEKQIGFKAQDLQKILPEVVMTDSEGYLSVDYSKLTPLLVEAIKEQQKIIESQKAQIDDIKALLDSINAKVEVLENKDEVQARK